MERTVLLTGASRGIGKAIYDKLVGAGYKLIVPSRKELDLANKRSVLNYCGKLNDSKIDILINNAGINYPIPVDQLTDNNLEETMEVNLISPIRLIRTVVPGMKKRGWGRIINISSAFGIVARERQAIYAATKHGINGVTKALALELGPDNILVNSICPGFTDTELTRRNSPDKNQEIMKSIPLGRFVSPKEIAALVEFLVSEKNSYLNGSVIVIDGGFICR